MKRLALLALAATMYVLAAWAVRPGFYDEFAPPSPYRWSSPPPSLAIGNLQPLSGHGTDPVLAGSTAPVTVFTPDSQVTVSFLPGSFKTVPGASRVAIDITPETAYPKFGGGFTPATNVYLVAADAPLVKEAVVQLGYSNAVPAPSHILGAPVGKGWRDLGASNVSAVYTISTRTGSLGYFVAGYSARGNQRGVTVGGGLVPVAIALVLVVVLVAGVPLALRSSRGGVDDG